MKKTFHICLIATNEDLKKNIYRKLFDLYFMDFGQLDTLGSYKADTPVNLNGENYKFSIFTQTNQFNLSNGLLKAIKNADSSYIAFELSDQKSWNNVKSIIQRINQEVIGHRFVLAGNISKDQDKKVNQQEIDDLVGQYKVNYHEICVDTGENVKTSFEKFI